MGNDRFFPIGITGEAVEQIEDARAVCRNCGVQEQCLEFALATNQQFEYGVQSPRKSDARYAERGFQRVGGLCSNPLTRTTETMDSGDRL